MFAQFNRFKKPITIRGKAPEKIVLTRVGKSNSSNFKSNFVYTALLQESTKLENGDVFSCSLRGHAKDFIVVSVRNADASVQATVYECNGIAQIYRSQKVYDEYDNLKGEELKLVESIPTNHVTVNATMRLLNAGLLPSTTKEFRLPLCDIKLMDRIVLDGEKFCVDAIDKTKFAGLLSVQTSNDNRKMK